MKTSRPSEDSASASTCETTTASSVFNSKRTAPAASASATFAREAKARPATARTSGSAVSSLMRRSRGRSCGAKGVTSAMEDTSLHIFSAMTHAWRCVRALRLRKPLLSTGITTARAGASTCWTKTTSARSRTHFTTSLVPLAQPRISSRCGARSALSQSAKSTSTALPAAVRTSLLMSRSSATVAGNSWGSLCATAASPSLPRQQRASICRA
mmetsp:Transcript_77718/g.174245  ORF Transcript_77718/g.174245 Transcript_77718/m.174245 type:complete len:213 (-) Transcript_77718:393-1031(-)